LTDEAELDLDELQRIAGSMPQFPWLLLSGGEPFLRDDLPAVISLFQRSNGVRHITIPTNALLPDRIRSMTEAICSSSPGATLNLALSIDGVGEKHDHMRGSRNGFNLLLATWEQLSPLRNRLPNLSIKFHTVLSSDNYADFDEIRDFVRKLRPDAHTFDFIRGNPADSTLALPPEDELPLLIDKIKAVLRWYGGYERLRKHHSLLKSVYNAVMEDYYAQFMKMYKEQRQAPPCVADRMTLVLGASGEASLCEMLNPFGSFREHNYDYQSLCASEASRTARLSVAAGKCSCYHPCYQTLNVLFRPLSVAGALARRLASG
jgi:MoaA/NifB/PqqE/SkfB family radical SAM enzyme